MSRNNRKFHTVLSGSKCPDFFTLTDPTQLTKVTYTSTAVLQPDEWFEVDLNTLPDVSNPLEKLSRQVNNSLPKISKIQYFQRRRNASAVQGASNRRGAVVNGEKRAVDDCLATTQASHFPSRQRITSLSRSRFFF